MTDKTKRQFWNARPNRVTKVHCPTGGTVTFFGFDGVLNRFSADIPHNATIRHHLLDSIQTAVMESHGQSNPQKDHPPAAEG